MNIQALQNRAVELWKTDQASARKLGKALIAVRDAMKHGEFTAWWKEQRMDENRVYYCIRVYEGKVGAKKSSKDHKSAMGRIPVAPAVWKRFRKLCGGKRDEMLKWATQAIAAWCDGYEKKHAALTAVRKKAA